MIEGFEDITYELTDYEQETILPRVLIGLEKRIGKQHAVTSTVMVRVMKDEGIKVTGARIRKIIHEIRVKHLIPRLISTSKGYSIAETHQELDQYILSLKQRQASIRDTLVSMQEDYSQWMTGSQKSIFNNYGK